MKANLFLYSLITFSFPSYSLAWDRAPDQSNEPEVSWIFEAPSSHIKEEFSSIGLNGDVNPITSAPIVSEGMVFFSTYEGEVYALDERDGSLIWTVDIFESSSWGMALHEEMIIFGEGQTDWNTNSRVTSLNKNTGDIVWSYATGDLSGVLSIIAHDGSVVFSTSKNVFSLDAESGEEQWVLPNVEWPGFIFAKDGVVLFQERNLNVHAIDVRSGETISFIESDSEADYNPRGTIAIHEENIFFTSGNREANFIHSYHIDGEENWNAPLDGISLSSIVVDECCVFFGTENGQESALNSLEINSGKSIWRRDSEGSIRHTPLLKEDRMYLSDTRNRVVSIYKSDGSLAWEITIEGSVYTPVTSSQNGFLFGTFEGAIYSILEP